MIAPQQSQLKHCMLETRPLRHSVLGMVSSNGQFVFQNSFELRQAGNQALEDSPRRCHLTTSLERWRESRFR